ncbi:S1C family serine protease [Evansella cellulosilytica]|uniref:Peptidase S1 and S6 chymotrypsin/Hap n=1 Tax=Evansella cellulosilytica (strain ATCC 21833 / DSM 2522 / FERM P-1141 / JCM 9156 / N-4) TaxID=649639 RepID=E6TT59_EVAC2|nr:trypsin-like peptidase domain-containing protein [Evansella cellulosilytica]ADU31967.1 peptidase S1 and S6 chymotrypsin/Hap [Evansella cellulosilytica DSM 2522]
MKLHWIISLIFTVLILGVGAYGFYFIYDHVPKQLDAPSSILAYDDEESDQFVEGETRELTEIIHDTQKLVVKIETEDGSIGSGFLYNDMGDIVTNAHVVAGVNNVTVTTADSRQLYGTVIGISDTIDIALVRVDDLAGTDPLPISNTKAEIGEEVLALGSPFGLDNTVTTGIISGLDRDLDLPPYYYEGLYQISAPIAPGNSGGPLVYSATGEVIGINSAAADQGSIGFSIPIIDVLGMIQGWSQSPMTALPTFDTYTTDYGYYETDYYYTDEDYALYLVEYYYDNLIYQDFLTAYSLLGSNLQTNMSYESLRNEYIHTDWISIDDIVVTNTNPLQVFSIITKEQYSNNTTSYEKYKVTHTIGYENDHLKILTEQKERIN